jgi:flagellar L-ring protein precursor FlgH
MRKTVAFALVIGVVSLCSQAADGSMFEEQAYQSLVSDQRASRIGDVITVLIQEHAAASSSVDAKSNRGSEFGLQGQVTGHDPRGLNANVSSKSDGGGQVARSGGVTAQMTATVVTLEPNGDLRIAGQQQVEINGETQMLTVSGRVRPRDISDSNTVLSSRLAEASITFNGRGYLAERSQPNILSRFFHFLGL